jgi:hypothetical protein
MVLRELKAQFLIIHRSGRVIVVFIQSISVQKLILYDRKVKKEAILAEIFFLKFLSYIPQAGATKG